MSALNRKLIRDLLNMKGQVVAICLVMACGVATFITSLSTMKSLESTHKKYYDRTRFAHIFTRLKRAPNSLADRISEIPGVSQVQTRIVVDVTLDVPGVSEPAVGRLVSIPERQTLGLNELYLGTGRYIEPGRSGEVLVGVAFAEANNLKPGDTILAVINGRRQELKIVGIALSPEYLYSIRGGELLPDDKRFGVFWIGYDELAPAYNMDGAFNDVALTLMPGASEADVLQRLDHFTESYGGLGAYGRKDQLSNRFVTNEMKQLRAMALVAPLIFLVVSAFLLNVVLNRVISTQREQIAVLKAFGYTKIELGLHYLKLVLLIVVSGVALGTSIGAWLGHGLTEFYTRFFRFPVFEFHLDPGVFFLAIAISSGSAILGTLSALWKAVKLPPAEAMQPEPPASYRPTIIERAGLQHLFSQSARMILRNLERQPLKSSFSCLGIALAVAVLILGSFTEDSANYIMEFQFNRTQRQDLSISFVEPTSAEALYEIQHLPGVFRSEPYRSVPVRLRFGHRFRQLGIMGLTANRELFRLMDSKEHIVTLPTYGVVLSEKLAELLRVRTGDKITVEVLEGLRPVREVTVTGIITDFGGVSAYMDIRALQRLMREGNSLSGAFLTVDPNYLQNLYTTLKITPRVSSVTVKKAALLSLQKIMEENLLRMKAFNVVFASIIAFGVVYNSARISLSERSRELATLRVIGFTRAEVSMILLGELAVLAIVAIPIGLVIGYGFAWLGTVALNTETQQFPLVVSPSTYAFSVTVVLIAAFISGIVVRRRLDHLDLIAVLKSRE